VQSSSLSRPAVVDDSWFEEAGGLQKSQQCQISISSIEFTKKKKLQAKLTFSLSPLLQLRCNSHPCAAPSAWKCHTIHHVRMEQNKSVTYIQRKHVCFLKGSHFAYLLVAVHPRCVKVHFLSLHHPTSRISIDFTTVPTRKEELAMQGGTPKTQSSSAGPAPRSSPFITCNILHQIPHIDLVTTCSYCYCLIG
jgi:hypothetical protein